MVIAFAKETLRAMQDAVSIYEAIFAEHATVAPSWRLLPSLPLAFGPQCCDMAKVLFGDYRLVGVSSIRYTTSVATPFLVQ
jgi:hypothetical protein